MTIIVISIDGKNPANQLISSWWFQQIWKMLAKFDHLSTMGSLLISEPSTVWPRRRIRCHGWPHLTAHTSISSPRSATSAIRYQSDPSCFRRWRKRCRKQSTHQPEQTGCFLMFLAILCGLCIFQEISNSTCWTDPYRTWVSNSSSKLLRGPLVRSHSICDRLCRLVLTWANNVRILQIQSSFTSVEEIVVNMICAPQTSRAPKSGWTVFFYEFPRETVVHNRTNF